MLIATKEGHAEIVRELLQYNAKLESAGLLMVEKEYRKINIFECALVSQHFEIAKLLVHAGYDLTQEKYLWTNEEVPKQLVLNLEFWCWLRERIAQPITLLGTTKHKIRNCLGNNIHRKVLDLDLPIILRNYILEVVP